MRLYREDFSGATLTDVLLEGHFQRVSSRTDVLQPDRAACMTKYEPGDTMRALRLYPLGVR